MPTTSVQVDYQVQRIALLAVQRLRALSDAEKAELASLERRHHRPTTLEELVAWEREFGAETHAENERRNGHPATPAFKRELYKSYAREFNLPYAKVKAAVERATLEGLASMVIDRHPLIRLPAPTALPARSK
jgi:hypothetical protein